MKMVTVCTCFYIILISCFNVVSVLSFNPDFLHPVDNYNLISSQLFANINKPRHVRRATFNEPPQYMLDLYNEVANSEGLTKSPLPHGASLVRALPVQVNNEHDLTFVLDIVPDEESIIEGELQIFHHHLNEEQRKQIGKDDLFKINLFLITEDEDKRLLASNTIANHYNGWRSFSVGDVVKEARWKYGRICFTLEIETLGGETVKVFKHYNRRSATKPVLVLFNGVSNNSVIPLVLHEMTLRKSSTNLSRAKRSIQDPFKTSLESRSGCELQNLHVNFEKIGWSWMVYPKEYDAYQCLGSCSFPLGQEYNPTNHATVASLVHYLSENQDEVAYPSCVPTGYKSLSILYYDIKETVILTQFDGMVATQCGCR